MSLKSILADLAPDVGMLATNANDKAILTRKINRAAREIWEGEDIPGCLREQLFVLDQTQQLVSLPSYVWHLRKLRHYDTELPIGQVDMKPRYAEGGWAESGWTWRIRGKSALKREIGNTGVLTLTIPAAEDSAFSVVVTGSTAKANRTQETISFAAGDTERTTTNSFSSIESITQPDLHSCDVTITDINGNELAVLANNEHTSSYTQVQVMDWQYDIAPSSPYIVEALYKPKLYPFVNDYDEFPVLGYDDAIYWKSLEILMGEKDPDKAAAARGKCMEVLGNLRRDATAGQEKRLDTAPVGLYGVFDDCGNPFTRRW